MTLESKTCRHRYIGNGTTKTFPFAFKVWKNDQIRVYIGNGKTETDVSSTALVTKTPTGGSVTFDVAPRTGQIVVIKREMPYIQQDDYINGTRFNGEEIEDRFDQDCAERQDLCDGLSRAITIPETSNIKPGEVWQNLEDAIDNANDAAGEARSAVSWLQNFLADVPEGDISLNNATAWGSTNPRTLAERFADTYSPRDFGASGDGVTNDTAAFAALESVASGRFVNLSGKRFVVDAIPFNNLYYNGSFIVDGETHETYNCDISIEEGYDYGAGVHGRSFVLTGSIPDGFNPDQHRVIKIGAETLVNLDPAKAVGNIIAIGDGVMSGGHPGSLNIGIGTYALHNLSSTETGNADRNTAVGTLALFGTTTGRANVAFGRDTGQCITSGNYNVCIGYAALYGRAPIGLDGNIDVQNELTGSNNVCVGYLSAPYLGGESFSNTVIGSNALYHAMLARYVCAIGENALHECGINVSSDGKNVIRTTLSGTYSQSGNVITVNTTNHNAVANRYVEIKFLTGETGSSHERQLLKVDTVIDSSEFTIRSPVSLYSSGNCEITLFEQEEDSEFLYPYGLVGVGRNAGRYVHDAANSVFVGNEAGMMDPENDENTSDYATVVGCYAGLYSRRIHSSQIYGYGNCRNIKYIDHCCIVGTSNADFDAETPVEQIQHTVLVGSGCAISSSVEEIEGAVCVGFEAGNLNKDVTYSTFVGIQAGCMQAATTKCVAVGRVAMFDNENTTDIENSTAIGNAAQVTGSNEVQLGNHLTTTYVYGTVQTRSDARDKTDISDTVLGLDFVKKLKPVDFVWNYRDAYIDFKEEKNKDAGVVGIKKITNKNDYSRKRTRHHHGFVAQDVKKAMDSLGVDFGGYQDHKINGGKDVLTLGYEEFIAPIVKAIQELDAKIEMLEVR